MSNVSQPNSLVFQTLFIFLLFCTFQDLYFFVHTEIFCIFLQFYPKLSFYTKKKHRNIDIHAFRSVQMSGEKNSQDLLVKVQKKVLGKMVGKNSIKLVVDDNISVVLDDFYKWAKVP